MTLLLQGVLSFFNSQFFNSLVTVLVGLFAFLIYKKQNKDSKKDAANIILLEIKNAERCLNTIKEKVELGELPEDKLLMITESWNKYKYLFVRDFDRDEWDKINEFYNQCKTYDQAVIYNNSFFQKNEEQLRVNVHRTISNLTHNFTKKISTLTDQSDIDSEEKKFNEESQKYVDAYMKKEIDVAFYSPRKPLIDAKSIIDNIEFNLSLTSIGIKLKKLAKLKD